MEPSSASASLSDSTSPRPKTARILVVEDQRLIAKDLEYRLQQLGYLSTGIAASGEAVLHSIKATRPDLILMDISLQGPLDGIQVAEHVQTHFNIPVVYVTAHTDHATLERAKHTHPSGFLIKPYEDYDLKKVIEQALQ